MKRVHKYTLEKTVTETQIVDMPAGAAILTAALQTGQPRLWALVDPDQPKEPRRVRIVGTGHEFPAHGAVHIATMHDDTSPIMPLVWHVFEVFEATPLPGEESKG